MNNADLSKSPRLYVDAPMAPEGDVSLSPEQAHYLRSVMRREIGDCLRLFNGRDGEFAATLSMLDKKKASASLNERLKDQPSDPPRRALYFAPIKKTAMDFLIEKACELGATDLHPVLTQRTEVRKIKAERITGQIIQACEQCERLDIPRLHDLAPLEKALQASNNTPVFWACERADAPPLENISRKSPAAFLIGPEGGFTEEEKSFLSALPSVQAVSLGPRILRAETAALYCLSQAQD